jgi:hypothetical protein
MEPKKRKKSTEMVPYDGKGVSNVARENDNHRAVEINELPIYPYDTVSDDHCETPIEAFNDIKQLLLLLSKAVGKDNSSLAIYDPYFCEGSVIGRLQSLGFENVYNKREDFYHAIEQNRVPPYDILITNPPYSTDHMERLLRYCETSNKPWLLLLPNYVYMKEYFQPMRRLNPFFISPLKSRRYLYTTPKVTIKSCCS